MTLFCLFSFFILWLNMNESLQQDGTYCTKLNIENADLTYNIRGRYSHNDRVQYTCRNGNRNTFTITCNQGDWTGIKSCSAYCDKLNNEKQSMNFTSDKDKYMNGDVIEYECIIPDPVAEGNATCMDGKWIKTVECKVKPCPHPDETPNGSYQIIEGEDFVIGTAIQYVCHQGYQMVGDDTLNCSLDGWTGTAPTCKPPATCGKPPALADGDTKETIVFLYRHDEKVEYICQNLYQMEGGPFKTCKNGEWIGQMRCLKPCTVDKDVMTTHNIRFRYSYEEKLYVPHNDVINFSCTYGTRHVGTVGMRQKCVDGAMNFPTCE